RGGSKAEKRCDGVDKRADDGDGEPGYRGRPDRFRQFRIFQIDRRKRQAGEEDEAEGDIAGKAAACQGVHRSASGDGVEEGAGDMAAPPTGRAERIALTVGQIGQQLVVALRDYLRIVELMAAYDLALAPQRA